MNWRLVGLLCALGVLMGAASVFGLTKGVEGPLWLVIGIICVLAIIRRARSRWFFHGFIVGLIGGAVAPVIQFLFFSTYLANNPDLATRFAEIPGGMEARYFVLALTPVIGLVSGSVLGLVCWLVAKLAGKGRARAS